ncbi:hypothetical protein HZS_3321, partial [Henneguya salminicola]
MKAEIIVRGCEVGGGISPDIITSRVILGLYFKKVELTVVPLTSKNKSVVIPEDISSSKLPICYDIDNNKHMDDILDIESYYESRVPQLPLICDLKLQEIGALSYKEFLSYLKTQNPDGLKKMKAGMEAVEQLLAKSNGPYINGENPCLADCIFFPKLYQIKSYFDLIDSHDFFSSETFPR